jgi:hypothetical protein
MKKFTTLFLTFLCLSFNIIGLKTTFAVSNNFTQGIYKLSDLNPSKSGIYTIQNISGTEGMYLYILDKDQVVMESIRLIPSVQKLDTVPIKPDYVILIIGKGEVYFTSKQP